MINGTNIRIRHKKLDDARNDYRWQTDPELSDLDAIKPLAMSYDEYVTEYREQFHYPSATRRAFAIETLEEIHIGNCVYYNIDRVNHEAEVGIMIGNRDYWNRGFGTDAMRALVDYIFRKHDFKRLYLKTLEKNLQAQHSFCKCGFTPCGNMERDSYRFLQMELTRTRWLEQTGAVKPKRLFHLPTLR